MKIAVDSGVYLVGVLSSVVVLVFDALFKLLFMSLKRVPSSLRVLSCFSAQKCPRLLFLSIARQGVVCFSPKPRTPLSGERRDGTRVCGVPLGAGQWSLSGLSGDGTKEEVGS